LWVELVFAVAAGPVDAGRAAVEAHLGEAELDWAVPGSEVSGGCWSGRVFLG